MPLLIKKDYFLLVNGYPEGNISQEIDIFNPIYLTKEDVYYNDKVCVSSDVFLIKKLKNYSIEYYTVFYSIYKKVK